MAPATALVFLFLLVCVVAYIRMTPGKKPRLICVAGLILAAVGNAGNASTAYREIAWGAPRLVNFDGPILNFSNGKSQRLAVSYINDEGKQNLILAISRRMTLADVSGMSGYLLSQGWARTDGSSLSNRAQERAQKDHYGIWGGNSWENDKIEFERLKGKFAQD